MPRKGKCVHCLREPLTIQVRGLCGRCALDPAVKALYPSRARDYCTGHGADMTAAELDALIAERLKPENRPSWWPIDGVDTDPDGDD